MIKNIFFDFDGVILDSMPIRDKGFEEMVSKYTQDKKMIEEFLEFHRYNAGLSRFFKFRYFFEKMLKKDISEKIILDLANDFSEIMKRELTNKKYLIKETVDFITNNYTKYNMYIVSGSEQNELRYLCKELGISDYFKIILGSPIHKNDLVKNIISQEDLNVKECILIGDSINDYDAAITNDIDFYGYNNEKLKEKSEFYINTFKSFKL